MSFAAALPYIATAGASALGSIGGSMLAKSPRETQVMKQKRALIDDLLASLKGEGSFNDLFKADEATFQKSFVDPAKQRFQSQIAPGIQQEFIHAGLQRGTGLDDALSRAGVEMDQLLNQNYMDFQQGAQNRQSSALSSILGNPDTGQQPQMGTSGRLREGIGGYLGSKGFETGLNSIRDAYVKDKPRKGFAE